MTTQRITDEMLENVFSRYCANVTALGLVPEGKGVTLSHGSKSSGIAYRVNIGSRFGGLGHSPAGDDFLGFTKRSAYEVLADRCRVLEDVARAMRNRA